MCDLHAGLGRPVIARGDHGSVGDRVGIGNADLDQVGAGLDDLGNQHRRRGEIGVAGCHERHERTAFFIPEPGKQRIDAVHGFCRVPPLRTVLSSKGQL